MSLLSRNWDGHVLPPSTEKYVSRGRTRARVGEAECFCLRRDELLNTTRQLHKRDRGMPARKGFWRLVKKTSKPVCISEALPGRHRVRLEKERER